MAFHFLLFEYLKGTVIQEIKVTIGEVPDWETRVFLEKVIVIPRMQTSLWHWANFIACIFVPIYRKNIIYSSQQKVMLLSSKHTETQYEECSV